MAAVGPFVQTVLGDVAPEQLGHTQPHEHVLSDMSAIIQRWGLEPVAGADGPSTASGTMAVSREFPASVRELVTAPVRPDTYDWIRRNVLNQDNMRLTSEADAVSEMQLYRAAGGGAVVDSSSIGMGRDPLGLARVSRATAVHIVMGSGYYVHDYHPAGLAEAPPEAIHDEILRDLQDGVGDTGIRAGIIGEIGLSWPVHPVEDKVLRAAAKAQALSGVALQIHPGRDPRSPHDAMRIVAKAGGVPERTIMSHIDRTLTSTDAILELARTGCWLELDLFGQESSYYALNPDAVRPNDATRIDWIMTLFEAGYGDRVLVAQDICQKVYLRRYGGPGYTHILEQAMPLMRRKGMTEDQIRQVTVTNPASVLAQG
jgi:phosphotriesterase-related protein